MTPYWMSVCDTCSKISGTIGIILGLVILLFSAIFIMEEDARPHILKVKPSVWIFGWLLAVSLCIFIPSMSQLREAYLLDLFAKTGTAENAKIVAERVENLIKMFAEGKCK